MVLLLCMRDGGASFVGHTPIQGNLPKLNKKEVEIRLFLYSFHFFLAQTVGEAACRINLTKKVKVKIIFFVTNILRIYANILPNIWRHILHLLC